MWLHNQAAQADMHVMEPNQAARAGTQTAAAVCQSAAAPRVGGGGTPLTHIAGACRQQRRQQARARMSLITERTRQAMGQPDRRAAEFNCCCPPRSWQQHPAANAALLLLPDACPQGPEAVNGEQAAISAAAQPTPSRQRILTNACYLHGARVGGRTDEVQE